MNEQVTAATAAIDVSQLDVEARDERGWTNVHIAVHNNRPDVLDFLLKNGANVFVFNDNGETPLHFAAALDSQPITNALLKCFKRHEMRQFIDSKTYSRGTSALHVAAKNGSFGVVWLLLSYGANFEIKNDADKRAIDVTRDARIEKMLQTVELDSRFAEQSYKNLRARLQVHPFFELDASLHSRNNKGLTILQIAVINEDVDVTESVVELRTCKEKDDPPIELLICLSRLGQCCDDMKRQLNTLLRMCDKEATLEPKIALEEGTRLLTTALTVTKLYAGEQQHLQVIDETLEVLQFDGRVDENARYYQKLFTDQKTELYSFLDILKLTIGAPIALLLNVICTVYLGSTVQKYDLTEGGEKLPSVNLELNKQDANGWTPLHYAVHSDKEDMVKALLELKSDATLVTKKNKKTPLHMAVKNGHLRIVQLLLDYVKVDGYVDEVSEPKGLTALHFAVKAGRLDIVKCLLRKGANLRVNDKKGRSCVELAKDAAVVEFLKLVDESFENAENGKIAELVKKMKSLRNDDLMVIGNVRNAEGLRLTTIAKAKCDGDVYSELLAVLSDDAADNENESSKDARENL